MITSSILEAKLIRSKELISYATHLFQVSPGTEFLAADLAGKFSFLAGFVGLRLCILIGAISIIVIIPAIRTSGGP
jgi:hypothetical protein